MFSTLHALLALHFWPEPEEEQCLCTPLAAALLCADSSGEAFLNAVETKTSQNVVKANEWTQLLHTLSANRGVSNCLAERLQP